MCQFCTVLLQHFVSTAGSYMLHSSPVIFQLLKTNESYLWTGNVYHTDSYTAAENVWCICVTGVYERNRRRRNQHNNLFEAGYVIAGNLRF